MILATRARLVSRCAAAVLAICVLLVFLGGALVAMGLFAPSEFLRKSELAVALALGLWTVGFLYEAVREWRSVVFTTSVSVFSPHDAASFGAVLGGAVLTYFLSIDIGLGAVVASALVGVVAAVLCKPVAVAAFAGSFVGMASSELFGYLGIVLAGAVAGFIFVAGKHVFNGFGGKLGTTAWAGCLSAAFLLRVPMLAAPVPEWDTGLLLMLYSVAGAVVTFVVSVRLKQGPVLASAVVGLVGGLVLPAVYGPALGNTVAAMVFCASFAGMSAVARFPRAAWMVPAGVFCALAFMYSAPYLGGAGGKLGTIAFASVIGLRGVVELFRDIHKKLAA